MSADKMEKRKREEYEMQLFGFHSKGVYDALLALIQEEIQTTCKQVTQSIIEKYKPDEEELKMLLRDEKKLAKCYYRQTRAHLPALENCVNKIVSIPPHVLLDEDKIQAVQYTDEEFRERLENLENLQVRLKRATMMNAALKSELEEVNEFDKVTEDADTLCTAVEDAPKVPDISRTMIKLIDSCRDLEHQLDSVRQPPAPHTQRIYAQPLQQCNIDAIS